MATELSTVDDKLLKPLFFMFYEIGRSEKHIPSLFGLAPLMVIAFASSACGICKVASHDCYTLLPSTSSACGICKVASHD
eukprot:scaffold51136_cov56-Cyclotella_meneghiniana.AAC.4